MGRKNNGSVTLKKDGLYHGRVRWTEENGKPRDYKLKGERSESAAWQAVHKKRNELKAKGVKAVDAEKLTFLALADEYERANLFEAVIFNGRKVAGVKSLQSQLCSLRALKEYFGKKRVQGMTADDLEKFKLHRLRTPTKHGTQRKIASVNRELELARAMFNFAIVRRWVVFNPFTGSKIIERSSEEQRDRVLNAEELDRLIESCRKRDKNGRQRRLHLIPFILVSVHTAARRGELLTLRWSDVTFSEDCVPNLITVSVERCKTERKREIPLSPTARREVLTLWEESTQNPDDLVFGFKSTPKTAFMAACRDAGIENYRFHDNRHTGTTLMVDKTDNPLLVQKITGHTQDSTFRRYYNPSVERLASVTEKLG